MSKKENREKHLKNFFRAILSLETEEECRAFFEDVCTIKEVQDMSYRLEVARLLSNGEVFSDISKKMGTSSATIGRVNKCLNYGPGGYAIVLERLGLIEKERNQEI